jgi:hypothetical protein
MDEKLVRTTAKLYEARDAAKVLLGDRYRETMWRYGMALVSLARRQETTALSAATAWAKEVTEANPYDQQSGMEAIVILAAAVELLEQEKAAA